mgnify:FL=1
MIHPIRALRDMVCLLQRESMSAPVRSVLDFEEKNGARMANLFRYALAALIAIPIVFAAQNGRELIINLVALSAYLLFTILHTVLLRRRSSSFMVVFNYLAVLYDYVLISGLIVYYSKLVSPGNFAHAAKNPTLLYFLFPLALTVLQFRLRLLIFALVCLCTFWWSLIAYGVFTGMPLTNDWNEYLLGPAVILSDAITRPVPFVGLALLLSYSIYRSIFMIRRIGDLESRRASLARFFSPDVVEELSSTDSNLSPGVRQRVTILFMDIRNFTKMSEGMDSADLAAFLTDFRDRMIAAIFEHGGTIDKFVGDAIMATFGTPRPSPVAGLDARNAVQAGLAMKRALADLNRDRERKGLPLIGIGIGIHTGEVFCGTIGSEGRVEYTVIGDAVNTASRIESMCKFLKVDFLISEAVFEDQQGAVRTVKMPLVRVKGKEFPVATYQVLE